MAADRAVTYFVPMGENAAVGEMLRAHEFTTRSVTSVDLIRFSR
jgi:hypothetical protein